MREALERLIQLLPPTQRPPPWVSDINFASACALAYDHEGCIRMLKPDAQQTPPMLEPVFLLGTNAVTALVRLALGEALEHAASRASFHLASPGNEPGTAVARSKLARLYNDSFLVSVWTNAHYHYIAQTKAGLYEPPPPSVRSMPSSLNETDFSDLFSRRWCPRFCPKVSMPMLNVLMRATNPGSRGWDALLETSLNSSSGVRLTVVNSVTIAMTGMHPHLHPYLRPKWNDRVRIAALVPLHLSTCEAVRDGLVGSAPATKESMRRTLASIVSANPAMHTAMARVGHPVGYLVTPPHRLPARGMEAAMDAYITSGQRLLLYGSTAESLTNGTFKRVVNEAFLNHSKIGDPTIEPGADASHVVDCNTEALANRLRWEAPWLGKGTASVHAKVPLVSVASDVFATAFRANFLPFWAHSMSYQLRACRLDAAQHDAIHGLNTATRLCSLLTDEQTLRVQRMALTHQSAGIFTMEEVALMFGAENVRGTSSNGGAKNPMDAARALSAAGPLIMAKLLSFARVAWLCEELVIVELGPLTKKAQEKALLKRFGVDLEKVTVDQLPMHATHLCTCTECKRISNAHSVDPATNTAPTGPSASFNELGVSCSMLCTQSNDESHLRCAKRSSAALRTAVAFEEEMKVRRIEDSPLDLPNIEAMFANQQSADAGIAARVRRDSKNAFEQRPVALACGEQPLFVVPILGRAVRIWNEWYSLCTVCGAMFRVFPNNRFGGDLCCLRCDTDMLIGPEDPTQLKPSNVNTSLKEFKCRFCDKVDPQRQGARWKEVKAPRDESDRNKLLPPPLRIVFYCPQHFRSWVVQAHRVLSTRVILSHLAINAKPIYGADEGAAPEDRLAIEEDQLLFQNKTRKRKRKSKSTPQT